MNHVKIESFEFKAGEPCWHPGCASHISHPCEKCGRFGARGPVELEKFTINGE